MIQKEVMDFICATGLVKYRFVVIDKVTDIVQLTRLLELYEDLSKLQNM